jgi:alpha-beta hydrolase superfamily lysophospholipase
MTEPAHEEVHFRASDGYEIHVAVWRPVGEAKGRVVVLHGVQSHSGWYHSLGKTLAEAGYHASFPNRRGSGPHQQDRGHAPSGVRLVNDVVEWTERLKAESPVLPVAIGGISWGGKVAVLAAARRPDLVDAIALICPGLEPRVGVSLAEKLRIARAFLFSRRKRFPIPLADPALFTENPEKQAFIRDDPLSLREGTAGLMAASFFIDRMIKRAPRRVRQPALLMLAGRDRIVDNARTLAYFETLATTDRRVVDYPDGCHTLEFDPDPTRYARDLIGWLDAKLPPGRGA